jgi:forkhead box protein N
MDLALIDSDHEIADFSGDDNDDNDLTNLTWLQDQNLLQNIRVCNNDSIIRDLNEDNENVSPPPEVVSGSGDDSVHKNITSVPPVTYNPHLHRNAKPPYSFSSLIFMAIESSPGKALPVKDIYQWIVEHYPYYQTAPSGWKNTVRHNLSLNKCFRKLDKAKDELIPIVGKGSLWCVDPDLRPNLLQAVRRTPAHIYPYMSLAKTNTVVAPPRIQLSSNSSNASAPVKKALSVEQVQSVVNLSQPNLFPFLSRRLLIPITKIIKKDKEADAAVSMLTLQCNVNNNINVDATQEEDNSCEEVLPDAYVDDLNAPVVTVTVSPTNDHNYYNRNSSPQVSQVYQVIHVSDHTEDLDNNNSNNNLSQKRKLSITSGRVEVKKEDEDSNDEGMRGAEALLNLASSNKQTQSDRPIILKKCKKE